MQRKKASDSIANENQQRLPPTSATTKKVATSPAPPAPLLNRFFSLCQKVVQYVSFAVLAFFLLHYVYSLVEHRLAEDELNGLIKFSVVNGQRTMYRCVVADAAPVKATAWLIHGVGSSWLINTPPLWYIHNKLKGVEFCSYARPGFAFTGGVANATDVEGTTSHFLELVDNVTPKDRKIILVGHSYGGAIAVLAASELRSSNKPLSALALLDAMPILNPADNETIEEQKKSAGSVMAKLVKLASSAEIAALLGVMRLSVSSKLIERLENQMKYIPAEFHRAFRHEVSSPSLWKTMIAEVERSNITGVQLSKLVKSVLPVKLLGDLPMLIVRATDFVIMSPDEKAMWLSLVSHDIAPTLSSHVEATEIPDADHMFYGKAAPILERLMIEFINKHV